MKSHVFLVETELFLFLVRHYSWVEEEKKFESLYSSFSISCMYTNQQHSIVISSSLFNYSISYSLTEIYIESIHLTLFNIVSSHLI